MTHGSMLHWAEALSKNMALHRRAKLPLAKPVKLQTHHRQHAYSCFPGPKESKCLFFLFSPHVLFMGRPLAPSESLVKSCERFLSSSSHNSFSALTEHIIWTLIERNFPLGRTTHHPSSWLLSLILFSFFSFLHFFKPIFHYNYSGNIHL